MKRLRDADGDHDDDKAADDSGVALLNPGGGQISFASSSGLCGASQTDWGMIVRAAAADPASESDAADALERVARRYWPAIYAFIRSSGRDIHEAADLTQGFVCDVLLVRNLLASADPRRGRFRTLLLSAVKNYLRDQHRRARRLKRSVKGAKPLRLDQVDLEQAAIDTTEPPEKAFSSLWGATLIAHVLEQVRSRCVQDGLGTHWKVFEERIVMPIMFGHGPASYADLVSRYGLKDASQAANLVITIKRRVVRTLVQEVRRTVQEPHQVTEELRDLLQELEGSS